MCSKRCSVVCNTERIRPGLTGWLLLAAQVPVALATSQPERRVKPAIERLNMENYFDAVVTAEDNGSPEVRVGSLV